MAARVWLFLAHLPRVPGSEPCCAEHHAGERNMESPQAEITRQDLQRRKRWIDEVGWGVIKTRHSSKQTISRGKQMLQEMSTVTTSSLIMAPSERWSWDQHLWSEVLAGSLQNRCGRVSRTALESWRDFHTVTWETSSHLWKGGCPGSTSRY